MKIAVIPARGGSKRLPGKNTKELGGKPLIQWSIDAALESGVFDHVCVSTDSPDIAHIAESCGAEVPFLRPVELATDEATTASALHHFVSQFDELHSNSIEFVCLLQPTSPLRSVEDIRNADQMLADNRLDAVVSVCQMEHPYQLCNKLGPSGSLKGFVNLTHNVRSQEQEVYYRLNGAIYYCRKSLAMNLTALYNEDVESRAYVMTARNSVDIDTELDFRIADALVDWQ